jgi:2-phospho-L-lactate/phosphoenolpyruvate guanylyltransferase
MRLDESVTTAAGDATRDWWVVFPVKSLAAAKSRLSTGSANPGELALAFFRDALAAAVATSRVRGVVVATSDARVRATAESAGAVVIDDDGHPGINAAARWGAQHCGAGHAIAVIVSDLPCLTPLSLDAALRAAEVHATSFLADLDGTGTTMWCATAPHPVDPHFGIDSRRAHRDSGAVDLVADHPEAADALEPARCDVDTELALQRARDLGVGPATVAALATGGS